MTSFSLRPEDYDAARLERHCGGPVWAVVPARAALLVHDLQPHYLRTLSRAGRRHLLARVVEVVNWADGHGVPVLASGPRPAADLAQRGLLGACWGMGLSPKQAARIALPRLGAPDVTRIAKRAYSAFYATDLEAELRRRGRDQLVVVGIYASHGILATSVDAISRDIQVFVPFDATADYTAYRHAAALDLMGTMSARVLAVDDLPGDPDDTL
ncbi:isochorismatase family protein [Streptomyces sp. NPDC006487]|uniref:isochorismatase family protein n=1 Tax=Streptomyces sp. NPDC006487 TaxID=3364748 RepID=UPI0036C4C4C1